MLSIARKRREAERNKKLEEQFNKADTNSNGKIRPKQMMKIFEANDISVPNLEEDVAKLADKEGWITLTDFIKFALPTELCKVEFLDKYRKEEKEAKSSVKKERKKPAPQTSNMDQIEMAFRKFDVNRDGYLSREEFDELMSSVGKEQADRIFKKCDTSGDNQVSLDELRSVLQRDKASSASDSASKPSSK